jgi:hypothetical protein
MLFKTLSRPLFDYGWSLGRGLEAKTGTKYKDIIQLYSWIITLIIQREASIDIFETRITTSLIIQWKASINMVETRIILTTTLIIHWKAFIGIVQTRITTTLIIQCESSIDMVQTRILNNKFNNTLKSIYGHIWNKDTK